MLLAHKAPEWGLGECSILKNAQLMLGHNPGALAAKGAALAGNAALILLVAAVLRATGSRNGAILAATLLAAAPAALRGPFLSIGVGPLSTGLLMLAALLVSLNRESSARLRSDLLTGAMIGLGLVRYRWFGALLLGLVFARYRRGDGGWWRPAAVATVVALILGAQGAVTFINPTLTDNGPGGGMTTILPPTAAVMLLLVTAAALAGLLRPQAGTTGELAVAAGVTGMIVLVISLGTAVDPILVKEDLALAWLILVPTAVIGFESLVHQPGDKMLALIAVAALGVGDILPLPLDSWQGMPVCREVKEGFLEWGWSTQGGTNCPDGSTPWEDCFFRAGRDVTWEGGDPILPDGLSRPAEHIYALGVGEGLAERLGTGRDSEVARLCSELGPELEGTCTAGIGSRSTAELMEEKAPIVTPCSGLDDRLGALCAQGLGAGILLRARRRGIQLENGIEFCSRLPSVHRAHCIRGFAQTLGFTRRGASDVDPSNWRHCIGLPEDHYVQCMGGHAANFGWPGELSLESGIKSCVNPFQEQHSKFCLVNLGCSLGFHFSRDTQRAWDICKGLPDNIIVYCVEGLGDGIGFANPGDLTSSVKACEVLPIEHRSICYHRVGNDLGLFMTDDIPRAVDLCTKASARATPYCLEGAGEAVGWPTGPNITASMLACEDYPPELRHYCHYGLCESYGCKLGTDPDDPVALWHELPPEGKPFCAEGLGDSLGWRFGYNATDAMALCDWLPEEDDRVLCYLNVGDRIHWRFGKGPEAVERCLALPPKKSNPCMRGLGRFASWQFGSLLTGRENTCAHEPLQGRPFCAMMFGRNVLFKEGMTAVKEACDGLAEMAPHCWRGVGWALGWLVRSEGLPKTVCTQAGDLAESCHKGICTGLSAVLGDTGKVLDTAQDHVERGTCLPGIGAGLVWYADDDAAVVAATCATLPLPDADECAQGAGKAVAQESLYLYGTTDKAREFCEAMNTPLTEACLAGIGNASV